LVLIGAKSTDKKAYHLEYRLKNKEILKRKQHEYYSKFKDIINERHKGYKLKWKYGITMEDRNKLQEDQNGLCAICECEKPLVVDHDHVTRKVRGLLCQD